MALTKSCVFYLTKQLNNAKTVANEGSQPHLIQWAASFKSVRWSKAVCPSYMINKVGNGLVGETRNFSRAHKQIIENDQM